MAYHDEIDPVAVQDDAGYKIRLLEDFDDGEYHARRFAVDTLQSAE